MNQFEMLRAPYGSDEDLQPRRRLDVKRLLALAGAMMLAGSFWWFLGRILLGI